MIQIDCCDGCVPPKRHTACWDTCPDYIEAKAEAFEKEQAKYEARRVDAYVNSSIKRMKSHSNRGRGINHHAK